MKKIIVFSSHTTLESGGVGTHLKHLIREVKQSNSENSVILGAKKVDLIKIKLTKYLISVFMSKSSVEILYFNLYVLVLKKRLMNELNSTDKKNEKIIIHCHDKYSAVASLLIKDLYDFDISIVQTLHAPFAEEYKIIYPDIPELITYTKIIDAGSNIELDKLIGVDILQTDIVKETVEFKHNKITVIPNAVDINELEKVNIVERERKYFIIARHLHVKNGVIYGIMAFQKFLEENQDYDLLIMGDGPERNNLEDYINKNNIAKFVSILGRKSHKESLHLIKNSKASLIPSIPVGRYIEATSLTMLESMYMGVPVIASNIGGLAEVIENDSTGFLFEPKDYQYLGMLMKRVVSDITTVEQIKINAKEKIIKNYTSKEWFKKISNFY